MKSISICTKPGVCKECGAFEKNLMASQKTVIFVCGVLMTSSGFLFLNRIFTYSFF